MADKVSKVPENIDGKYYVDDQCTACEVCVNTASENFKMNDDGSHAYVYKQPETDSEESACKEALEGCPSEAIGDDGK